MTWFRTVGGGPMSAVVLTARAPWWPCTASDACRSPSKLCRCPDCPWSTLARWDDRPDALGDREPAWSLFLTVGRKLELAERWREACSGCCAERRPLFRGETLAESGSSA